MSVLIKGMDMPKHAAADREKGTVYRCCVVVHPDDTAEIVIDNKYASMFDNGHNVQRYPLMSIPSPHGRLIDADLMGKLLEKSKNKYKDRSDYASELTTEAIRMFIDMLEYMPTIIEAEE